MHDDTASDIDDDEYAANSNDMTKDTTLFTKFNASGLPASLKVETLCHHNCLGWGRPRCKGQEWQACLPVCCQASPARRLHRR
eukprot:4996977-Pleurochrysis_carterae.AAC.1